MNAIVFLFGVFVMLQCLDFYTTIRALQRPGNYEANPLLKFLMDRIGVWQAMAVVKAAATLLVWHFLAQIPWQVLFVIDVAYAFVVYRNAKIV